MPPVSLLSIPQELQLEIISYLPYLDQAVLKMTCKHFNEIVQFRPKDRETHLVEIETTNWANKKDLYFCSWCSKLHPASRFVGYIMDPGEKLLRGGPQALDRSCVEGFHHSYDVDPESD